MGKKAKKEAVKPEEPKKEAPKPETLKKEPPKSEPPKKDISKAEALKNALAKNKSAAAAKAAEKVAEAVKEVVAPPVVEVVKKQPRKRFVREKQEKRPQPTGPALPPRSSKATAKLMSKGLVVPPKDDTTGTKPR